MNRALLLETALFEGSTTWFLLSHHAREVCATAAVLESFFFYFFFWGCVLREQLGLGMMVIFNHFYFFRLIFCVACKAEIASPGSRHAHHAALSCWASISRVSFSFPMSSTRSSGAGRGDNFSSASQIGTERTIWKNKQ